jgi:ATP synthase protein I
MADKDTKNTTEPAESHGDRPLTGHAQNFNSRLENLDSGLNRVRSRHVAARQPVRRGTSIGLAFRLITELVAGLVVGGYIGYLLDTWLGTMPVFFLIFFVLGMAAGMLNVIRTAKLMQADMAREEDSHDDPADKGSRRG